MALEAKKAHFIGLGGVGMSATAKLLKDLGVAISGSDEEVYEPVLSSLTKEKLSFKSPYSAQNIPPDADLIVIGKNAKLVAESNAEVAAAFASGKRILSYPEVLGELSNDKETVVVAGSYGKSTSTALLSHCLVEAGLNPSYWIPAISFTPKVNAKMGKGKYFVLEGDEYPSSNTDPRSKFLHYHPSHLLITPLAHDHINIFPTPEEYLRPFTSLIELVPKGGTIVACAEGPLSKHFIKKDAWPIVTYGVRDGDYHAGNIEWGEATTFSILHGSTRLVTVTTTLLGEHNIQNIVGVAALLFSLRAVTPEQFAAAVASFRGITRRLDKKSYKTSIPVYEGFGSSYEKMQSAMAAMRLHFPTKNLRVVFEPNTIGWRSRATLPHYDDVFSGAHKVYIFNPPHDGKASELSLEDIVERVQAAGIDAVGITIPEEALELLDEELGPEDAILLSSSGALGGLAASVPRWAEKKFPA